MEWERWEGWNGGKREGEGGEMGWERERWEGEKEECDVMVVYIEVRK